MKEYSSLAIIGMACNLPKARSLKEYWELMMQGKTGISKLPSERFMTDIYFEPDKSKCTKESIRTYVQWAGLAEYQPFDYTKCRPPVHLWPCTDMVQLAMCQTAAEACRHAKLNPFNLPTRNVGVYFGSGGGGGYATELSQSVLADYTAKPLAQLESFRNMAGAREAELVEKFARKIRYEKPSVSSDGFPQACAMMTAAAVMDSLELDGPGMILDAACSSSLYALSIAARDLQQGNVDMAIVGGSSYVSPVSLVLYASAQSAGSTGSYPFSANADGLIASEGNACILVKTLENALRDGDLIQAVIHHIGVATDGKGKSLWAPQSEGQYRAIHAAYPVEEKMQRLAFLEAHITSTTIGDTTELTALTRAFKDKFTDGRKRPVGSVKANIGHTLETAGIAGMLKAVMVLQNNTVPPQIACDPLNANVDWEALPFYIPRQAETLRPSPDGKPRLVGVNSFGIGGLNVHVSLEEALPRESKEWLQAVTAPQAEDGSPENLCDEPVAIIGMGSVYPGSLTLEAFRETLFSGKDPKSEFPETHWSKQIGCHETPGTRQPHVKFGGFVQNFEYNWRRHRIPPKQIAVADPLQWLTLESADAALENSHFTPEKYDLNRCRIIVGATFDRAYGLSHTQILMTPYFQTLLKQVFRDEGYTDEATIEKISDDYCQAMLKLHPQLQDETGSFTPSSIASRISKTYNFRGGAGSLDSGETAGMTALKDAINGLKTGDCDMVVCAGASCNVGLDIFILLGMFGNCPATLEEVRSPLDAKPKDGLPAQGAGTFILKRLSDAQRDGDPIFAVIHGVGCASVSLSDNPEKVRAAYDRAIQRAWQGLQHDKKVIQVAELSSAQPDILERELDALAAAYEGPNGQPVMLGEMVAQFGRLSGASSVASITKGILELEAGKVPALFKYTEPAPFMAKYEGRLCAPQAETPLDPDAPQLLAVSSWDKAGLVGHIILERYNDKSPALRREAVKRVPEKPVPAAPEANAQPHSGYRMVRVSAGNMEKLKEKLRKIQESQAQTFREAMQLSGRFTPADKTRMVIVTSSEAELAEQIEYALLTLEKPFADKLLQRKNIFCGESAGKPGKVAFLFPGQGSQYGGMLQELTTHFAPAQKALEEIDGHLRTLHMPTFGELTSAREEKLGEDVFSTQLSMLCADAIIWQGLRAVDIRPDVLSTHSFGEFPALYACGVWDFPAAAKATKIRCRTINACNGSLGGMLSTNAGRDTVDEICEDFPGEVYAASYNAPDQIILGGRHDALAKVVEILKSRGKLAKILAVPRPFHTPLMAAIEPKLYEALAEVPFHNPNIPLLSSVTNTCVQNGAEVRRNLAAQMTGPVRFVELIHELQRQGATLFIECGPKRVLTSLAGKILENTPAVCWAMDDPLKKDGLQFYSLRAWYEVNGYADETPAGTASYAGNDDANSALIKERPAILRRMKGFTDAADGVSRTPVTHVAQEVKTLAETLGVLPETLAAYLAGSHAPMEDAGRISAWLTASQGETVPEKQAAADASRFPLITAEALRACVGDMRDPLEKWGWQPRVFARFASQVMKNPPRIYDPANVKLDGKTLIYGDNPTSRALAGKLAALGFQAELLPYTGDCHADAAETARRCASGAFLNLIVMTPFEPAFERGGISPDPWEKQRQLALSSFLVIQQWYKALEQHKTLSRGAFCAVTRMGGDFGLSGQLAAPAQDALPALARCLCIEAGMETENQFFCRAVDLAQDYTPDESAEKILASLDRENTPKVLVGWNGADSYSPCFVPEKPMTERSTIKPQGTWIITGGGRGITARIAAGVAAKYGLKLHLIGSSPAPNAEPGWLGLDDAGTKRLKSEIMLRAKAEGQNPISCWKSTQRAISLAESLRQYDDAGVAYVYHACDVSDYGQLKAVMDEIHQTDRITGILHGAGIEKSSRFTRKLSPDVMKTWAIKVDGLVNLLDLTRDDPLTHVIGMGSAAAATGAAGQTDYSMANEVLAKILTQMQAEHPDRWVTCFHWGPWDEIGMAARPEIRALAQIQEIGFLPPESGVAYVLEELESRYASVEKMHISWSIIRHLFDTPEITSPLQIATPREADVAAAASGPSGHFVAKRLEPGMFPAADWSNEPPVFSGNAIIYGDNADARALECLLERHSLLVLLLPETDLSQNDENPGWDSLRVLLDDFWAKGPAPHLFLMNGRNPEAVDIRDKAACNHRRRISTETVMRICRHWLEHVHADGLWDSATLAAGTMMNGDYGFSGGKCAPEGAAVGAVLKNIALDTQTQNPGLTIRQLDASSDVSPEFFAEKLVAELRSPLVGVESGILDGKRMSPQARAVPASAYPPHEIRRGGVWLFVGGARGITAECALAMGKRFGVKLCLLGSSPYPELDERIRYLTDEELQPLKRQIVSEQIRKKQSPGKAWDNVRKAMEIDRNLRKMREAGIEAEYFSCDITDSGRMETVLDDIREKFGPIEGVVYGAGIMDRVQGSIINYPDNAHETNFYVAGLKTDSVIDLWNLLRLDPLKHFVMFGSISGRYGVTNNIIYGIANDMMCKLTGMFHHERPDCRVLGFHWHLWSDVGIATNSQNYGVTLLGLNMIKPEEGVIHLLGELSHDTGSREVVISDGKYAELYWGHEMIVPAGEEKSRAEEKSPGTMPFPLLESLERVSPDEYRGKILLQPASDPFLRQHRLRNTILLPGVIATEMLCETVRAIDPTQQILELRDLTFLEGLRLPDESVPKEVSVRAVREGENVWACSMHADFLNSKGKLLIKDRLYSHAKVVTGKTRPALASGLSHRLPEGTTKYDLSYSIEGLVIHHGPVLQELKRIYSCNRSVDISETWGEIVTGSLTEFVGRRGTDGWQIPVAALDGCFYHCNSTAHAHAKKVSLPKILGRLSLGGMTLENRRYISHCRIKHRDDTTCTLDFALFDEDGNVILKVEDYITQFMPGSFAS